MSRNVDIPNGHAMEIAEFLMKPAGKTLLSALYARRPPIGRDAYDSGLAQGWEQAVDEIAVIATERLGGEDVLKVNFIRGDDDMDPNKRPPEGAKV